MSQLRVLGAAALLFAGAAVGQTTLTVPGGDHRSVCVSGGAGTWTLVVGALTGNVSYIQWQLYWGANPTKLATDPGGPDRLCVACKKAAGRVQSACFSDPSCDIDGTQEANVKISKPSIGSSAAAATGKSGPLCTRVYTSGRGTATVTVTPPPA